MTQTVLLVGATGMLGGRIAHHLLDHAEAHVRLLVRPGGSADQQAALDPLLARGAEVVTGDLADRASLDRATAGVDVIVSAVQGGPEVIVDGQVALAEAGRRQGVRRILPSDFALDLFKATPGEHAVFDLRRRADERIAATGLEHVHVLQGGFMDLFLPGRGAIDLDAGTVAYWGEGTRPIEVTSVEDTARVTARVALDRAVPSGKFAFAGDRLSLRDAAAVLEAQTGRRLEGRSRGSEADLRAALARAQLDAADPFAAVMLAYQLYMLTGQTALTDLQNARYPDVRLETFAQFAARSLPPAAAHASRTPHAPRPMDTMPSDSALPGPGLPYVLDRDHGPAFWNVDFLWVVLASGAQTGGAFSLMWELGRQNAGPPPHVHDQDEYFFVTQGQVTYAAGDQVLTAGPGSYVYIPRGTVHSFRVDTETAELLNMYTPAGFERTILELAEPAPARTLPPPGRPVAGDPARMMQLFREVGMHAADGPDPLERTHAASVGGPNAGAGAPPGAA